MAPSILINGSRGRMGQAVASAAREMGFTIGAQVDLGDDIPAGVAKCDVVVDFSAHSATRAMLSAAVAQGKPVVLGTTGHAVAEKKELLALAARVPCVWAGNFSVGVNVKRTVRFEAEFFETVEARGREAQVRAFHEFRHQAEHHAARNFFNVE